MAVLDLAPFSKEGVGFVEEENGPTAFGRVEQLSEILRRLAYIFVDHGGQVDTKKAQAQVVRQDLGGHRLSRSTLAGEEGIDAKSAGHLLTKSPTVVNHAAMTHLGRQLSEQF